MAAPGEEGRSRTMIFIGIGSGLLVAGLASGYFLGSAGAADAKTAAENAVKTATDRATFCDGELLKVKTECDGAKKGTEIDLHLAKAVEWSYRSALEVRIANFGTAGEFLDNALNELRAAQKLVSPEGAKRVEALVAEYEPARSELLKRADTAAAKLIAAVTVLSSERETGIR